MMDRSLRMQIQHLCSYISDKTLVQAYINTEHGLNLALTDIIEVADADNRRHYRSDHKPMMPSPLIVTHKHKGYDPLAMALFRYHADRATGSERLFWLNRLTDRKAKPKTTIEL